MRRFSTAAELERTASFEMSEMGLSDFLKQIGATSLSPKLVLPVEGGAPPLSPKLVLPVEGGAPPLASLHARLEAEIESVNVSRIRVSAAAATSLTRLRYSATDASAAARELARIRAAIQHRRATFSANGGAGAATLGIGG